MATMIPDIPVESIENDGERVFYSTAQMLPNTYTIFYSYKYYPDDQQGDQIREADFVIVHPMLGYLVIEVKQGEVNYNNGRWYEYKKNGYQPMNKDPLEQARSAMYGILDHYKLKTGKSVFPLELRYVVCFPECSKITGDLPAGIKENSIWTLHDLDQLDEKIWSLFDAKESRSRSDAIQVLINKVLSPSFKVFFTLNDQINTHRNTLAINLTEEQERILYETEEDKRKIFLGAAGTGKTYIAMEKAKRLAVEGKKVFLTCYNTNLTKLFNDHIQNDKITAHSFHEYIYEELIHKGYDLPQKDKIEDTNEFYQNILPETAYDHYSLLPIEDKFDAIIVDEGQDFTEAYFLCLEEMMKPDGEYYIFADPNQNLFTDGSVIRKYKESKHKLSVNLRNSDKINDWITPFTNGKKTTSKLNLNIPVISIPFKSAEEERRLIQKEIGRLVSQGLHPDRITILSPHKQENSSLQGLTRIKEWPLVDFRSGDVGIKFSTIRAFKGLEADVSILIGIKDNDKICTTSDIYVGASRARFMLYVFHEVGWGVKEMRNK
jgi:hypothetical protein